MRWFFFDTVGAVCFSFTLLRSAHRLGGYTYSRVKTINQ